MKFFVQWVIMLLVVAGLLSLTIGASAVFIRVILTLAR